MQLFFIRHGQSVNNLLWEETGENKGRSEDPELTQAGHEQAKLLAAYIREKDAQARSNGSISALQRDYFGFSHIYTSLMVRSVATGTYLANSVGRPLNGWVDIHECGGIFLDNEKTGKPVGLPGKTRSYFSREYQDLVLPDTLTDDGWWNRPFEAHDDRPLRAKKALATLIERHGGSKDRVAIISHGGFYMELIRVMFHINHDQSWFLMNNTAISLFDFREDGNITLVYHNRTDHLPEDLAT